GSAPLGFSLSIRRSDKYDSSSRPVRSSAEHAAHGRSSAAAGVSALRLPAASAEEVEHRGDRQHRRGRAGLGHARHHGLRRPRLLPVRRRILRRRLVHREPGGRRRQHRRRAAVHQQLGYVLARALSDADLPGWPRLIGVVAGVGFVAYLLHVLVEKPAYRALTSNTISRVSEIDSAQLNGEVRTIGDTQAEAKITVVFLTPLLAWEHLMLSRALASLLLDDDGRGRRQVVRGDLDAVLPAAAGGRLLLGDQERRHLVLERRRLTEPRGLCRRRRTSGTPGPCTAGGRAPDPRTTRGAPQPPARLPGPPESVAETFVSKVNSNDLAGATQMACREPETLRQAIDLLVSRAGTVTIEDYHTDPGFLGVVLHGNDGIKAGYLTLNSDDETTWCVSKLEVDGE